MADYQIVNVWIWAGFIIFIIAALTIDTLLIGNSKISHPSKSPRAAILWTLVWISAALIFNLGLWFYLYETQTPLIAKQKSLEFLTGYLIEKSLSVDNLFVFFMIFHQFRIPLAYQHRIFIIGIWSAIVLRLMLILAGAWLVTHFHWILYIMGAFLIFTGIKMFKVEEAEKDLSMSKTFLFLKRLVHITPEIKNEHFFVRKNNLIYVTPLLIALIFIEISDLIFAFDSIPAIFAITTDPFIVWTSNIFAILGLRALYFLLAGMVQRFHLLKYGIAILLMFVGLKMVVEPWVEISTLFSLIFIVAILIIFAWLSLNQEKRRKLGS